MPTVGDILDFARVYGLYSYYNSNRVDVLGHKYVYAWERQLYCYNIQHK